MAADRITGHFESFRFRAPVGDDAGEKRNGHLKARFVRIPEPLWRFLAPARRREFFAGWNQDNREIEYAPSAFVAVATVDSNARHLG